jgi:hypothetical protein
MKSNKILCKNCSHENPLYTYKCENCKSYLRERVFNIDFWNIIGGLIENPFAAFKQIIFSENKTFIIFLTLLIALKNLIVTRFFSIPKIGSDGVSTSLIAGYLILLLLTLVILSVYTFVHYILFKKSNNKLRFKDIYSTTVYSFIPYLFGLFFVFPVELIVFGSNLFSNNPYAFQIKPLPAYFLIGFEVVLLLWSILLLYKSLLVKSTNKIYSLLSIFIFLAVFIAALTLSSLYVFSI